MFLIYSYPQFQMIANHQMPGISFASGGDSVSSDLTVFQFVSFPFLQGHLVIDLSVFISLLILQAGDSGTVVYITTHSSDLVQVLQ